MASSNDIGGGAVQKFLEVWNRHPLSLFVLLVFINVSFVFMLFFNKIEPDIGITVAVATYVFTIFVLVPLMYILYNKKQVLYNSLDVLTTDIAHRLHELRDKLQGIEIWVGDPYEEILERLCPNLVEGIDEKTRVEVHILEILTDIQKDCGIEETSAKEKSLTSFALAKFYYKIGSYEKAWQHINNVDSTKLELLRPGEVNFCKALILRQLNRGEESLTILSDAIGVGHTEARCVKCLYQLENNTKQDTDQFIDFAEECARSTGMELCTNRLSTAFYEKGKYYCDDNEQEREISLRKAVEIASIGIEKFNSGFAYYNRACDLSVMAGYGIKYPDYDNKSFEEASEAMMKMAYDDLAKAFAQRPALAKHSLNEPDLTWFKEKSLQRYEELIGRTYISSSEIL